MSITNNLQADLLLRQGQSFTEKNRYSEAIATFNKALEMNPNYNFVHLHKGLALSRFNKYKEAVESVEHAINANPKNDVFWYLLGIIHFDHKNYAAAIKALERARKPSASCKAPLGIIGLCKMSGSVEFEEGYSLITKNYSDLRYNGFESRLLLFCETFLFNKGQRKSLLEQFAEIPSAIPPIFPPWSLAVSLLMRISKRSTSKIYLQAKDKMLHGDFEGAMECLSKVIEFDSKMIQAYKQKTTVLFDKGEYEAALQASRAVPDKIQDFEILNAQGIILHKLERYKEAAAIFKKICSEDPRDFMSHYFWGLCLIALKDESAALERFNKAVCLLHSDIAKRKLQEVYALQQKTSKN